MRRADALDFLNANLGRFQAEFGVKRLWLVGSTARDEAREDSDIDLLVEFAEPTWRHYIGMHRFITDSLHTDLDLISMGALVEKPRFRNIIERDAILIAGAMDANQKEQK